MFLCPGDSASSLSHRYCVALSPVVFFPCPTMVPYVHSAPSFCCSAIVDPEGRKMILLRVSKSLLTWASICIIAVCLLSSLLHNI